MEYEYDIYSVLCIFNDFIKQHILALALKSTSYQLNIELVIVLHFHNFMGSTVHKSFFLPFLQFWILSQGFLLHVIQPSFWNMKLLNSKSSVIYCLKDQILHFTSQLLRKTLLLTTVLDTDMTLQRGSQLLQLEFKEYRLKTSQLLRNKLLRH